MHVTHAHPPCHYPLFRTSVASRRVTAPSFCPTSTPLPRLPPLRRKDTSAVGQGAAHDIERQDPAAAVGSGQEARPMRRGGSRRSTAGWLLGWCCNTENDADRHSHTAVFLASGDYTRFALMATAPFLVCVSLYHENSQYCSAPKPHNPRLRLPEHSSGSAASSAAQPSGTAGLTPCVLNCLAAATNATECETPTNLSCTCTNTDFQFKARSCLQAECKSEDVAAVGLQQQQCAPLSLSATVPHPPPPLHPLERGADIPAPTASSAGSPGSPSAAPGSALSLFAPNGGEGLVFAVGVAVVGGLVGAVVV
ncbi:hypothetical protein DFH08DRAFT_817734 [Mycena albidolilacea]|uniref:CFEM domain-containing protein n=1 Tax=Mycena albidolilacea TaxID=1033008 RepID=A0AAD6ZHX4_9AGAR|nr:hypothetical protein DFH08DRAFT_817734 [Mycena albidolilacea]